MTQAERIARLKELDGKGTPEPWTVAHELNIIASDGYSATSAAGTDSVKLHKRNKANALLIAYLRNNALPIIEELEADVTHDCHAVQRKVEELEAENEELKAQILRMMGMTEADIKTVAIDSGKTIDEVFGGGND